MPFPPGYSLHRLAREHARARLSSGEPAVDVWLTTKALQQQEKRLSTTKVLIAPASEIAGFFTLAVGQVDFSSLPVELAKRLPRRMTPVAVLAWLGVRRDFQRRGFGELLLGAALADCHRAGETFPFVAVVVDCLSEAARSFFERYDFRPLPGQPFKLFLSAKRLAAMMNE